MKMLRCAINGVMRLIRGTAQADVNAEGLAEIFKRKTQYPLERQQLANLDAVFRELPQQDLAILRAYKEEGLSPKQIAAKLGLDKVEVFRSLIRTYADLRMRMRMGGCDPEHLGVAR